MMCWHSSVWGEYPRHEKWPIQIIPGAPPTPLLAYLRFRFHGGGFGCLGGLSTEPEVSVLPRTPMRSLTDPRPARQALRMRHDRQDAAIGT